MSIQEFGDRSMGSSDRKLAILDAVHQRDNVRLSALTGPGPFDPELRAAVEELRAAELVSASPVEGDLVLTSLPRLRAQERTKLHRLLYN